MSWRVSLASIRSSGAFQGGGTTAHPPGQRGAPAGRKWSAGTAGSSSSSSRARSAEKGTVRASRTPRVRARLARMVKIHVFTDERPSNESMPRITASHVSWTISSATARSRRNTPA